MGSMIDHLLGSKAPALAAYYHTSKSEMDTIVYQHIPVRPILFREYLNEFSLPAELLNRTASSHVWCWVFPSVLVVKSILVTMLFSQHACSPPSSWTLSFFVIPSSANPVSLQSSYLSGKSCLDEIRESRSKEVFCAEK